MLAAFLPNAIGQCTAPTILPYIENVESVTVPALPECVFSYYNSFSSSKVFESAAGPVAGFDGIVFTYNTALDDGITPGSPVDAYLISPPMALTAGTQYTISYRYGTSNPSANVDNLSVGFTSNEFGTVEISSHANLTGNGVVNYISQPVTVTQSGVYKLQFNVSTAGSQGLVYLDDIRVEQTSTMGLDNNSFKGISLYPNPMQDVLNITNIEEINKVEIYSVTGQKVYAANPNTHIVNADTSQLPGGVYIVNVTSKNFTTNYKIVKR